ncbi:hypothetical protein HII31_01331 [Pseudocercospora fuligena]|uniref:Uncharacterized protein n=1 Tax=Pseudocercospora fuligena TaxID=685502 RepID=A0A8H6RSA8_9PEZI|nr:hypothetical protein HII31_01331 [Pseudocercospora fuligena]
MPDSSTAESTQAPASNVIPAIQSWLDTNAKKIQQFWIGADWRSWARYDLFIALENAFEDEYLVNHGIPIWESYHEDEQVDTLLEHRDGGTNIAIRLRCENVNDNCGSFEDFSKEYQKDWTLLQDLNQHAEPEHEDTKVMLLGFSGQPMVPDEDEEPSFGELKPDSIKSGEVYAWYLYDEIKKADQVENETSS